VCATRRRRPASERERSRERTAPTAECERLGRERTISLSAPRWRVYTYTYTETQTQTQTQRVTLTQDAESHTHSRHTHTHHACTHACHTTPIPRALSPQSSRSWHSGWRCQPLSCSRTTEDTSRAATHGSCSMRRHTVDSATVEGHEYGRCDSS